MDTQPKTKPRIPTIQEVMEQYHITDPGVGYELWRIVTRPQRTYTKPLVPVEDGKCVGILWIGETPFGLSAFEQE